MLLEPDRMSHHYCILLIYAKINSFIFMIRYSCLNNVYHGHVEVYDQMIKCSIKKIKKSQNPKDKKLNLAKIIRLKNQIIFYSFKLNIKNRFIDYLTILAHSSLN
ncbi:hypothetical protein BpHYR1_030261 [Brachionus plicatilis]|uniref:Uncharacterized protein n=1 Tax=Brachionus plicatilis TaxID=10195 RepID=A0A3M7RUK2_BRAPC|nr:hypothetical protein BpHYR1_030261 [Brachionus plicatilis]